MGKDKRSSTETEAHNLSGRQKEDRSRSACEVGEGEGGAEVGCFEGNGACCEYAAGFRA